MPRNRQFTPCEEQLLLLLEEAGTETLVTVPTTLTEPYGSDVFTSLRTLFSKGLVSLEYATNGEAGSLSSRVAPESLPLETISSGESRIIEITLTKTGRNALLS